MEPIGKLSRNDTPNILMLPIASKHVSIKISDQYPYSKYQNRLNGIKVISKMQN